MRQACRQLLLRLLLLVVFFNTTVGVPLHAAEHLHGADTASAHACALPVVANAANAADGACADDEHGASHAQCVWCANQAQLAMALGFGDGALVPVLAPVVVRVDAAQERFIPQPQRWRFAARDPPSLS